MKVFGFVAKFLPCVAAAGALALAGCQDDNYDFNEVDMTVGIGGDGLTLPVSSTNVIKLEDVLELDGSECVVVRDNGDYVFTQDGGEATPAHPRIASINVVQSAEPVEGLVEISAVPSTGGTGFDITAGGKAQSFSYSGDLPDEVASLSHVDVMSTLTFTVNFPASLSSAVTTVRRMSITLPSYMEVEGEQPVSAGNTFVCENVPTGRPFSLDVTLNGLDFSADKQVNGRVAIENGQVVMEGDILVDVEATASTNTGIDGSRLTSSMTMDDITITSATGRFTPEINIDDLGNVEVTGVPDFLSDGRVRVDLYNPQVIITVSNDMAVGGLVDGIIRSYKGSDMLAEVAVPQFQVNPSGTTRVCICRRDEGIDHSLYDVVKTVDNLSDVIETIPERITFEASAQAGPSDDGYFEFDHDYTVKPSYTIDAPIMFDKDARIVYKDTLDGWHDDIEDFELADGAYINLAATVENRVPAYLTVDAKAVDIDGNEMGDDEISVVVNTTVAASEDGETPAETALSIDLKQVGEGALKRLDGIVFNIEAAASDGNKAVVGKTLNATKHSLVAKDIKVRLVGKIIGDFN